MFVTPKKKQEKNLFSGRVQNSFISWVEMLPKKQRKKLQLKSPNAVSFCCMTTLKLLVVVLLLPLILFQLVNYSVIEQKYNHAWVAIVVSDNKKSSSNRFLKHQCAMVVTLYSAPQKLIKVVFFFCSSSLLIQI